MHLRTIKSIAISYLIINNCKRHVYSCIDKAKYRRSLLFKRKKIFNRGIYEIERLNCVNIECSFRRNGSKERKNALEDESQNCMTRANESGRAQTDAGGCTLLDLWFYFRSRIINSCLQRRRSCFPRERISSPS